MREASSETTLRADKVLVRPVEKEGVPGTVPRHTCLSAPEEIFDEARNGRMFILVDDEDRENEGNLVIPAQMATPEKINFMARHGRGLICLAMTKGRIDALQLPLMSSSNETHHETAFTVSIEAKDGVTTGISTADRARTIAIAIDGGKTAEDIVSPGHIFPLAAHDGGVLVRAGHTEAAIDVARLAGLNPSGVICEIMNEDGTMARFNDLVSFARLHNLKIGTIRDLIAYRLRNDHLIERRAEAEFLSRQGGEWRAVTFWNKASNTEQIALVKGKIDPNVPTLVRMHVLSPFLDLFGEEGEHSGLLARSMEIISDAGAGIIVVINKPRNDAITAAVRRKAGDHNPEMEEKREYGMGAMILAELGVEKIVLLTNSHHSLVALAGYGLSIVGERSID